MQVLIQGASHLQPRTKVSALRPDTEIVTEVASEKGFIDRSNELGAIIDTIDSSSDRGSVSMRIDSGVSLQEAMQNEL